MIVTLSPEHAYAIAAAASSGIALLLMGAQAGYYRRQAKIAYPYMHCSQAEVAEDKTKKMHLFNCAQRGTLCVTSALQHHRELPAVSDSAGRVLNQVPAVCQLRIGCLSGGQTRLLAGIHDWKARSAQPWCLWIHWAAWTAGNDLQDCLRSGLLLKIPPRSYKTVVATQVPSLMLLYCCSYQYTLHICRLNSQIFLFQ